MGSATYVDKTNSTYMEISEWSPVPQTWVPAVPQTWVYVKYDIKLPCQVYGAQQFPSYQ